MNSEIIPKQGGIAPFNQNEIPLKTENSGADEKEIAALENRFHFKMPQDLKEFYKKHNGVTFTSGVRLERESCQLRYFHSIGRQYQRYVTTIDQLLKWQEMDGFIPMYYIPFCSDEADDFYYVCVDETGYGKIYYIFSEFLDDFLAAPERHGFIANSFTEFLKMINYFK